jgi:hypothetical protein
LDVHAARLSATTPTIFLIRATFSRTTEFFDLFETISRDVAAFFAAKLDGTERQWLLDYFGSDSDPENDEDLVHTIIARHMISPSQHVYQCQKCGRVHIQHRDRSNLFERFKPEATPHHDIFQK